MTTTDTEIICILDRSGSMAPLASAAITGLNLFIQEQRELEGNCRFTLVQFNQASEVVIARKPLSEVTLLGKKHFIPSGYTALLDAIGQTLQTAEGLLADIPAENHPERVIVHIITDGQENCSNSFSHAEIRQMIVRLEATEKWTFSFSGANMDAFNAAQKIGIKAQEARNWGFNQHGMQSMYEEISANTREIRKKIMLQKKK